MNQPVRAVRALVALVAMIATSALADPPTPEVAAELDARRLTGKAYYENDKYTEAAAEFRRCIELAPKSAVDLFNLGLVLMRAQEYDEALAALAQARQRDPNLLAVYYIEGIIHKRQNRFEEAVADLKRVIAGDPQCSGAYYNLGVCYKFLKQYERAVEAFLKEEELSPTDPSTQYQLITLYRRLGQVDNAERHTEIYDRVKDTVDEAEKTAEALERSKYTYIIEAPRLTNDLEPQPATQVRFVDATKEFGLRPLNLDITEPHDPLAEDSTSPSSGANPFVAILGNAVVPGDYDGDGDLDLYVVNASADPEQSTNRLYRNNGAGKFADVTGVANVGDSSMGADAVFGDYDNDGDVDLYVANYGPNVLYRNAGDGRFEDVSAEARANEPQFGYKTVLIDYDHDNDLDIYVANCIDFTCPPRAEPPKGDFPGQSNTLLRNNGDGTFSDLTDEAGLLKGFDVTLDVLYGDFDSDHDLDLVEANLWTEQRFFANDRMGRFVEGGRFEPVVPTVVTAVADGDLNRDGQVDLLIAVDSALWFYVNDGAASFTGQPVPLPNEVAEAGIGYVRVLDYNNDGWSDLLLGDAGATPHVLAGTGLGQFGDVTEAVGLPTQRDEANRRCPEDVAIADLDGDGDEDIVLHMHERGPMVLRNDGGNRNNWLDVRLVGKKVNRSGYGATVEIASGGHYQKQTYRRGWVHFGLGDLDHVDVVRVTWPNGVAQNVIKPKINSVLTVEEYVKVSASCGFLYSHNGAGFELINEILGIGPLGVPMAPGVYYPLDCTELTKIEGRQLAATDGHYELRLTEELREITFADQITLRVVDHPAGMEIIPNEMFTTPPFPEDKFFAVADPRPPVSAVDDRGQDVLDLVLRRDGRSPTFPRVDQYPGLAEPHSLTLDLGDLAGADRIMLYLDSWIYWAESSVGMAMAQDPRYEFEPVTLQVRGEAGAWQTVIDWVGLPTSKGIVVPVDLSGRFLCDDYHVRLSTNLCVYFDRIFTATNDQADRCRVAELPVAAADLHYRGFSQMRQDELGFERFDYAAVSATGSWSPPKGMMTSYGDVTQLLAQPDNMYVIFGPGDELSMRFDASDLPAPPAGWARDFIFYANGWVKDGDLNTKFSGTVEPLPFHGMSGYPYPDSEHYPDGPEHQRYLQTYNTRRAAPTVGTLAGPAAPLP